MESYLPADDDIEARGFGWDAAGPARTPACCAQCCLRSAALPTPCRPCAHSTPKPSPIDTCLPQAFATLLCNDLGRAGEAAAEPIFKFGRSGDATDFYAAATARLALDRGACGGRPLQEQAMEALTAVLNPPGNRDFAGTAA